MTKIEWCDESWNPIKMRCTPVSEGCENCYAKRILSRNLPGMNYPAVGEPPRLDEKTLAQPLHWKKPRRVFVMSMGDLFHPNIRRQWLNLVFISMGVARHHTYIVLTKRPGYMKSYIDWAYPDNSLPSHIWLGVTAENQRTADERIPILLQIPAAVRFVSVEPMMGLVDLGVWVHKCTTPECGDRLGWIICGGETGPGAKEMNALWATDLRDQCRNAGVPYFFKRWGAWHNGDTVMPREWPR